MTDPERRSPNGMTNDEMTRDIWTALYGDHSEGNPGLLQRMDRQEQKMRMFVGGFVLTIGAFITAAAGTGWAWLTGGHKP